MPAVVRHAAALFPAVHVPLVPPHSQASETHLFAVASHAAPPQRQLPELQVNPVAQGFGEQGSTTIKYVCR